MSRNFVFASNRAATAVLLAFFFPHIASAAEFEIRWIPALANSNQIAVEIAGIANVDLRSLRDAKWSSVEWQKLLSVYVEQGDLFADANSPAMIGTYQTTGDALRFEPQFPLEPGLKYRATFHPNRLPRAKGKGSMMSSTFAVPARHIEPTTTVAQIFPSGDVLPENLLKFYIQFSAPMSGGHIYEHIRLRNEAGKDVELPFLEIDEELWDPTMTRLTLFIDPGRIKRGVKPLEEIGPSLEEGKRYTLVIGEQWRDARGAPLKTKFEKKFQVTAPDRDAPDTATWKVSPPHAGSREPLTIVFPEPMDHALALRVIRVAYSAGKLMAGVPSLGDNERRWSFTPAEFWKSGAHNVLVQTTIEDLAGNNIGKRFEVDLFEPVQRRFTNSTVKIAFEVK